jgi:hypothetical protein
MEQVVEADREVNVTRVDTGLALSEVELSVKGLDQHSLAGPRSAALGAFISCATLLEGRLQFTTETVVRRLDDLGGGWPTDAALAEEEVAEFVQGSLEALLGCLRSGVLPASCPPADAECAATAARLGNLKLLLDGYLRMQTEVVRCWFEVVEEAEADPEIRNELLRHGVELLSRYAELLQGWLTERFQRSLEHLSRNREQRRTHLVRALLAGDEEAADELELDLGQHHVGLVAEGEEAAPAAQRWAKALERPLLLIGPIGRSWWGWLSAARPLSLGEERRLQASVPSEGARLAFGLEGYGVEGFRATHSQAVRAQEIGRKLREPLTYFGDVAVAALASSNPRDARAFVLHELRGIDEESPGAARIRETILAYFAAGHNAASAAAALGIHQQTVTNRLLAAEERLGHPVASRRVELETALRLRALLNLPRR